MQVAAYSPRLRALLFFAIAIAWAMTVFPALRARYSFGWDSSQFDRAVTHFDIARHQPHPPGYPLWVVAARALTPVLGNPNRAQVLLAILFTVAGLWFFHKLARQLAGDRAAAAATALLALSPVVCLYATSSLLYAVDLFASSFAGWLAGELWSRRTKHAITGFAIVAVTAGFRPSGAVFMLPLLFFALLRCARGNALRAGGALLTGAALWLAWLTPTALATGGFAALQALNRAQAIVSFRQTSIFYGAPATRHLLMCLGVCLYFGIAATGFAPPVAAAAWSWFRHGRREVQTIGEQRPSWATPLFFALWMAPNLAMLFLLHCGQPGYVLLSLPPVVLLLAWAARNTLNGLRWTAAGIVAALLVSWFPYERFMDPSRTSLPFLVLHATPRIAYLAENSQREIRKLIDTMPGRPQDKLLFCLRLAFEAPNIRTATYDFSDVTWAEFDGPAIRLFPSQNSTQPPRVPRSVGWLCNGAGLPSEIRAKYPGARRIAGNALYSFWVGTEGQLLP